MESETKQQKKSTAYFQNLFSQMDEMLASAVTQEEMVVAVKAILDTVKKVEERIVSSVANNKSLSDSTNTALRADLHDLEQRITSAIGQTSTNMGQNLTQSVQQLREEVNTVRRLIPTLPDYTETFAAIEAKIPTLPAEKLGEDYRNALEALPEGDKLSITAIEKLEERLKRLENRPTGGGGGGVASSRNLFQDYDLSSQLDGVTKTFNIPAVWNIISVDTSSFPHALRKNVDYTYTPQTITFTSEIDAATTLAAGQTVILTIVTG